MAKAPKDLGAWGRAHPDLATAAVNLWISGVSERAIFERYRAYVKEPPSYRELRASFKERDVRTRSDATALRAKGQRFETDGRITDGHQTAYHERRKAQYTEPAKVKLEDNMVKGYLAKEVVDPDRELAGGDFLDFVNSEYEVGS